MIEAATSTQEELDYETQIAVKERGLTTLFLTGDSLITLLQRYSARIDSYENLPDELYEQMTDPKIVAIDPAQFILPDSLGNQHSEQRRMIRDLDEIPGMEAIELESSEYLELVLSSTFMHDSLFGEAPPYSSINTNTMFRYGGFEFCTRIGGLDDGRVSLKIDFNNRPAFNVGLAPVYIPKRRLLF